MPETSVVKMIWKNSKKELQFPKNLPQERGCKAEITTWIVVVTLLVGSVVAEFHLNPGSSVDGIVVFVVIAFFGLLLLFTVGQLMLRLCYCIEELTHVRSRYENSFCQMLKDVMLCNVKTYVLAAVSLFLVTVLVLLYGGTVVKLDRLTTLSLCPIVLAAYCVGNLMKMDESPHRVMLQLKDIGGLDYGSGMAYSFFYGYLRMMLPDRGDQNTGLKEKIELFCNKEKLTSANFPVKKLFVLIPASGHIPASLTQMDHKGWLDQCKSLEEEIKNVAGVMGRSYKNSLYKIRDPNLRSGNNEVVYVVAEGATPIRTYHEAMKNDAKKGSHFMKYQKEVTLRFYTTLVDIIQSDKDCCNLCEIIYYKDEGENGHPVSLSDVLKERLSEIRSRQAISMESADEIESGNIRLLDSPSA
ncbi:stimulator of interferon genes protein homolog [Bacillus rossius redtenbacheri]|uniref:stimulator of interferon genes protein homolog n=1 Tax=Bacillus rossius redtenbacheri TaxID=93214 RepID=UPI002FDD7E88